MVGEGGAVFAFGRFVEFDTVVFDRGGFELFGDALLYVAGGLAYFELSLVGRVFDGVGVDP